MGGPVGKAKYMGIGVVEGKQGATAICPRCESRNSLRLRPAAAEAALKRRETLIFACTLDHEPLLSIRTIANASTSL